MQSNVFYALLHIDLNDENNILGVSYEGKSLSKALISLKHHPCVKGYLYSYTDTFDQTKAKLIASKFYIQITRHDIDEKQRKIISI